MKGILPLNKPSGITSAAAVRILRKLLPRHTAIGHAGTLDPLAQGVLPILVGTATRLQEMLHEIPKTYTVTIEFGYETDTLDTEGKVVARTDNLPSEMAIRTACLALTGEIRQIPPLYSAVKLQGRPLYRYARQGIALPVALQKLARMVHIFAFTLLSMRGSQAMFSITCSRGTYVRSLIRDLAHRLDSLATMTALVREASAGLSRSSSVALDMLTAQNFNVYLIPIACLPLPQLRIADAVSCVRLQQGQILPCSMQLFTSPRKSFLLAGQTGVVFGIGTQHHTGLHMTRGL